MNGEAKKELPGAEAGAVAEAFDQRARSYDGLLQSGTQTQRLRSKVYFEIERLLESGSSILDINCGTGTDAMHLSQRGMSCKGIDISEKMIAVCRDKAGSPGGGNPEFFVASFESFRDTIQQKFDLALSNFGGLNCVKDLHRAARELESAVKPAGYFVAVVMPPFSLWESLTGFLRGNWALASRRLGKRARAGGFGARSFDVFYHSARSMVSAFAHGFTVTRIVGLNIISPPPSSEEFIRRHPSLSAFLVRIDELIESIPFFRGIGDHYMIVFRRRDG